jgi:hypothetical protein
MSKIKEVSTQIATSMTADFNENTWTFLMPENYKVWAGQFAIVDKQVYDKMKSIIEYVNQECSVGSMSADLSHDFVDCLRSRLDKLEGVEW